MTERVCRTCDTNQPLENFPTVGAGRRRICKGCLYPPQRTCSKCGEEKPLSAFARQRRGWRGDCKACRRAYTAAWSSENPERVRQASSAWRKANPDKIAAMNERGRGAQREKRKHRTVAKYGITLNDYQQLLAEQGGGCAICGESEEGKALAVDHCHKSGCIRGLLCQNCNNGLGRFGDDPNLLDRAAAYVRMRKQGEDKP